MLYLFFSILCSSLIAVVFKFPEKYNLKLFPVIILNYVFAVSLGLILNETPLSADILSSNWINAGILIGIALLVMFFVLGYSTQKVGLAVTTISKEMSVVLPVSFSIFFYSEKLDVMKEIGILIALTAVFLSVYKKKQGEFDIKFFFLPVSLIFGIGFIDSMLKFTLEEYGLQHQIPLFSGFAFAVAGITGIFVSFVNGFCLKDFFGIKTLILGAVLGSANFGSMYFLMHALDKAPIESSAVYGINNIGIIIFSILAAILIFKEKITAINRLGILLGVAAIIILSGMLR